MTLRAPQGVPRQRHHESLLEARVHQTVQALHLRICCGSAALSDQCDGQGFATIPYDSKGNNGRRPARSVIKSDLAVANQEALGEQLNTKRAAFVCLTFSTRVAVREYNTARQQHDGHRPRFTVSGARLRAPCGGSRARHTPDQGSKTSSRSHCNGV